MESLLRTDCCWLGFFGKVYWPTPFNMHVDFLPLLRTTFAELSRKYPYSQTPAISRGCIEGKADARGLGVWLSQSLTFGNLAAAFGARFLRLQKSIIRQRQRQVQGCASGPWCLAVAELLCFWCCQVWKMKKSRRIASFLTLLSSKMKEVSQNCFVFDVVNF